MTLNGVMGVILCNFTELADFVANCVTVVEGRPLLSDENVDHESSFRKCVIYGDIFRLVIMRPGCIFWHLERIMSPRR